MIKEKIMNTGKNILKLFEYREKDTIYYKTDEQTREGTVATGSKDHIYKIMNPYYKTPCLFDSDSDSD